MRREGTAEEAVTEASSFATFLAETSPLVAAIVVAALLVMSAMCCTTNRLGVARAGIASGLSRSIDRARPGSRPETVDPIGEEQVLRVWLAAELRSPRFGARLKARLAELGCDESLVYDVPLGDPMRTRQLRSLISARGVVWDHAGPDCLSGQRWQRETHRIDRLVERARYGQHPRWVTMSGGTRLPRDAALRCRASLLDASHTRHFEQIADAYKRSRPVPPIILLHEPDGSLTAVEGHARLTGLALAMLDGPLPSETVELLVGYAAGRKRADSPLRKLWKQGLS